MNKKMREIRTKIDEKIGLAKSLTEDGENKDVAKAADIVKEIEALENEFTIEEKIFNLEKAKAIPEAIKAIETKEKEEQQEEERKAFVSNVKKIAKGIMVEGADENGGYTVPEDVSTKIRHYRESEFS